LRYLMVSTYPPTHCGIGAYAEQSVGQLRAQGHVVDIVSPDEQGNVDFAWDLRGGAKLLRLFELLPFYDRVVIQYHWAFFYLNPFVRECRWDTFKTTLSFILLFLRTRKIEVVAHEIPYLTGRQRRLYGWKWKLAPKLVLHTRQERERLQQHYALRLKNSRVELRQHHGAFRKFASHTQATARRQLGLNVNGPVFLCIGFIQRHKGFHRAIEAFAQTNLADADLYVVGSLRLADDDNRQYRDELYSLASEQNNVHIVESFVSNEEFDTWIAASDWVVLPYLEIWSSSVLARARLLERPSIVSAVGGLPEQISERDLLFSTDEELVAALQVAALNVAQSSRN
jgi:glycosyltransferase involved in cell wall biosynthesis